MKVVIIEPVGGHGGMEIYDFGVCKSLVECGCEVVLYTCDKTKGHSLERYFKINRFFSGVYGKHSSLLRFVFFIKGLLLTFFDVKKTKADVVYLHIFTFSLIEFLLLFSVAFMRSNIFVNVHDPVSFGRKESRFIKYLFGKLFFFKKISVTTHSNYSKSIMLDLFPNLIVTLMPHSDVDFLYDENKTTEECKALLGLDLDKKYILFFGQIKKTKGMELLLNAWGKVITTMPDAKLLVVGRCWKNDCSVYKSIINDVGIQDNVIWKDVYIEDKDVPCYFRSANAVVLPYTRIYSSGVLIRAIGYGTPVIVSDQPAFTEIIEHHKNGLIFKTNDDDSLAEQLLFALNDKAKCDHLKDNASHMLESKYSWKVVAEKMLIIFKGRTNA